MIQGRGRKPIPTRIKEMRGNPGKKRLNKDEPRPREAIPTCPKHLDAEAKREWKRVTKELRAVGLITLLDRAALAGYCVAWSRWVAAEVNIQKFGPVLSRVTPAVLDANGNEKTPAEIKFYPNPYVGVGYKALCHVRSFASEFGLTPSSRTRLSVAGHSVGEVDELDIFLGEKTG